MSRRTTTTSARISNKSSIYRNRRKQQNIQQLLITNDGNKNERSKSWIQLPFYKLIELVEEDNTQTLSQLTCSFLGLIDKPFIMTSHKNIGLDESFESLIKFRGRLKAYHQSIQIPALLWLDKWVEKYDIEVINTEITPKGFIASSFEYYMKAYLQLCHKLVYEEGEKIHNIKTNVIQIEQFQDDLPAEWRLMNQFYTYVHNESR